MEDPERSAWTWFLPALLLGTALLKLFFAWTYAGFLTGDDLEVVETAAKYTAGLDYDPWPIRSLFHPLVLAWPAVKLGALAGLRGPHGLTFSASIPTILFSTLGIWILYRFARLLTWPEATARVAAFLFAFHWLPLGYGATTFARPISTCLLLAAFLLIGSQPADSRPRVAGLLAGAAFAVRWSEGLVLVPLLAYSGWRHRSIRTVAGVSGGFLLSVALLVGLLDALTWGRPFASPLAFADLIRDRDLGGFLPRPLFWYGTTVLHWAGPLLLLLLVPAWGDRRARLPLAIALAAAGLLSLSPLKEIRYLEICIPFLSLAAALGWARLRAGSIASRSIAAMALVLVVPLGLERTLHLLRRKSESAIAAARFLAGARPPPRVVALEQAWAYGEKLYLGNAVTIRDLRPHRTLAAGAVDSAADGADAVCLYDQHAGKDAVEALSRRGFRRCRTFQRNASPAVTVYLPAGRPCPDP